MILKKVKIFFEYLCFNGFYYESKKVWKFLCYRYFTNLMSNKYWPVHKNSEVRGRVVVGKGARVGHRPNCIIQGRGKVFIGDYVEVGPNCVIISGNHAISNQREVVRKETVIGDYCWLASSSIILAGVVLGPRTIVGAGSVVTKSFPDGYCVIAGNPAKVIKTISKDEFEQERAKVEYYGYIREDKYTSFAKKKLSSIKFDYDLALITENKQMISLFQNK